jgi:hypothetical protein
MKVPGAGSGWQPRDQQSWGQQRKFGNMSESNPGVGEAPQPEAGQETTGEDITAIRAKISALQSEIDRLTGLIQTAVKKLED